MFTPFPYRRIDLIGREEELKDLALRLDHSRRVLLINGLGGIGKTEMCKAFFMDHYREYAYAGWFDWVSSLVETVVRAFSWESVDLPPLPPGDSDSLEERYKKILGFFQRMQAPALLVFDNIENPADEGLAELTRLPDTVKVIATSRQEVPGFDGKELDCLSAELCRALFYRYYDVEKDDEGVDRVVGRCARHTLTVELLARTAGNAGLKVEELERLLVERTLPSATKNPFYKRGSWTSLKFLLKVFTTLIKSFWKSSPAARGAYWGRSKRCCHSNHGKLLSIIGGPCHGLFSKRFLAVGDKFDGNFREKATPLPGLPPHLFLGPIGNPVVDKTA